MMIEKTNNEVVLFLTEDELAQLKYEVISELVNGDTVVGSASCERAVMLAAKLIKTEKEHKRRKELLDKGQV